MLYLDGISINKLKDELKEAVEGKRVSRIYQYSKLSLSIFFGKMNLYFSGNANLPVCYLKEGKEESLDTPMNFSLNLRKNLVGAELVEVDQLGFDRILIFKFRKLNEIGELRGFKLYFEIMGKHSNLILVDEREIIVDLAKKFSIEENKLRPLLPGVPYIQPIVEKKLNPMSITRDEFEKIDNLTRGLEGIGKISSNLIKTYDDLKNLLEVKAAPRIYIEDRRVKLATVFDVEEKKYSETLEYASINEMINSYTELTKSSEKFFNLSKRLVGEIDKTIKKNKKILKLIDRDIKKYLEYGSFKESGDILAANLFSIKRGMERAELFDFYNNENKVIELNKDRTPKENLEAYYNKYAKYKRGAEHNFSRQEIIEKEANYLKGVKEFVLGCKDVDELESIEEELIQGKYIKEQQTKKKKKKKVKLNKYKTLNYNGYEILYGRTNLENDNLTHKVAARDDMWLHAKDVPGGHVVIRNLGDFPEDILLVGAKIAAYLSKVREGEKVTIDYTLRKNLKKPKGSNPGFVIYHVFESILVEKPENIDF